MDFKNEIRHDYKHKENYVRKLCKQTVFFNKRAKKKHHGLRSKQLNKIMIITKRIEEERA